MLSHVIVVVLVVSFAVSLSAPEEPRELTFEHLYKLHLGYYKTKKPLQQSAGRQLYDCFEQGDLARHGLLPQPGEFFNFSTFRATLYGPPINRSSYEAVAKSYAAGFKMIAKTINEALCIFKGVADASDFRDLQEDASVLQSSGRPSQCAFNYTQYRTVTVQMYCMLSANSRCIRATSYMGRTSRTSVDLMHGLGFPGLHVLDYLYDAVVHPHPALPFLYHVKHPESEADLNVTLQIFGPCAVPFGIEKQIALRVALPEVLKEDVNIYLCLVQKVEEKVGEGTTEESSVLVTLTLGVFLEEEQTPFLEAFQKVTRSESGAPAPLVQFLEDQGLSTSRVVVHDVSILEASPDTYWGSTKLALKKVLESRQQKARMPLAKLGTLISSVVVAGLLLYVFLKLRQGKQGSSLHCINVEQLLGSRYSGSSRSSVSSCVKVDISDDLMKPWSHLLLDPKDVHLETDKAGRSVRVGKGSNGEVFLGLLRGEMRVAVKVLSNQMGNEQQQHMFFKEVAVLGSCSSPSIVQFLGAAFEGNNVYLVMEYMRGGDLSQAIHGEPHMRWSSRGAQVLYNVAEALVYFHSMNIIHLDVKPSNILIAEDGTAKLGDLGLATWLTSVATHETFEGCAGTFPYMAPEVLMSGSVSCKADIYSFGVVLWELVTGEQPFRGSCRSCRVPAECDQAVADFIDKCCSANASDRPSASDIVRFLAERLEQPAECSPLPTPSGCSHAADVSAAFSHESTSTIALHEASQEGCPRLPRIPKDAQDPQGHPSVHTQLSSSGSNKSARKSAKSLMQALQKVYSGAKD